MKVSESAILQSWYSSPNQPVISAGSNELNYYPCLKEIGCLFFCLCVCNKVPLKVYNYKGEGNVTNPMNPPPLTKPHPTHFC